MKTFLVLLVLFQISGKVIGLQNNGSSEPVTTLNYYYESLCPDCQQFDNEQLCPVWKSLQKYFKIDFVPYGNARTTTDPSGNVTIECQHGERECKGNILHGCALKYWPLSSSTDFICCTMSTDEPETAGPKCAQKLGLDFEKVKTCTEGKEGFEILKKYGEITGKLNPQHEYVPWVLFNGIYNEQDMSDAEAHLLPVLCKYIPEPTPEACNEIY